MIALGLTGSIGMGKSTVAAMFAALGVPVFDADAEVHRLQGRDGALIDAIEALHPGTTGAAGVDRALLGAAVLGDALALARLEALIHPGVGKARTAFLDEHAETDLVVLDIPLLFEAGRDEALDAVVLVSAPSDIQRARVLARPGMSEARFAAILARQLPDADKRARADFILDTAQPLAETQSEVERLVACLRTHGVRYCRECARSSSTPRPPG